MRKKQLFVSKLAALITVLMFLNLFTFVLAADAILQVCDNTPTVKVELPVGQDAPEPEVQPQAAQTEPSETQPQRVPTRYQPGVEIKDAEQVWQEKTRINVFHAWYDNTTGDITVKSDSGEKLVAPGTGSRYYFDICNIGSTGGDYWLDAHSGSAEIEYNGQIVAVPLEIKFYRQGGGSKYLVGGSGLWEPLTALDGLTDQGELSSGHYVRYVLDWQWPYEGDDILDTLLGDMAAEGEELKVWVEFNVYAEADNLADGGTPQTGDTSNIALWMGLFVCSGVLLIILLTTRKKEETDDK